ncbi:MAG TPA: cytochrome c oxidase subunit II [Terracidiphilus sp.]|nr:cytochrome c oxidase subunit II [Terracidiphilus sp.]
MSISNNRSFAAILAGVVLGAFVVAKAQSPSNLRNTATPTSTEAQSSSAISKQAAYPLATRWLIQYQQNNNWVGMPLNHGNQAESNLQFQPLISMSLTDNWDLDVRPVFRLFSSAPYVTSAQRERRVTGFGDTVFAFALSPGHALVGNRLLATGPTFVFPTATASKLGQSNWQGKPTAALWYTGEHFIAYIFPWMRAMPSAAQGVLTTPSILAPASTPAKEIYGLSLFVLVITGAIFVVVGGLLAFIIIKYHAREKDADHEPAQIYGSTQVELAWTVIPVLIVVVLFLTTARIIFAIQDAPKPQTALDVTVVGHQFWWEFRYPKLNIVTANELHVPVSTSSDPEPTYLRLLSADVDHSFWVPQLAGKTDLIPDHPNEMWIDPYKPGLYRGQCAQFCGVEHALMLIRVYADTPQQFDAWVKNQQRPALDDAAVSAGRHVFESEACANCHTISGTTAHGTFGPDLTHLMSRATIAAGAAANTPENLRAWIENPNTFKPGALMPAMQLSNKQTDEVVAYLTTLH